jgi:hypothetical protein
MFDPCLTHDSLSFQGNFGEVFNMLHLRALGLVAARVSTLIQRLVSHLQIHWP